MDGWMDGWMDGGMINVIEEEEEVVVVAVVVIIVKIVHMKGKCHRGGLIGHVTSHSPSSTITTTTTALLGDEGAGSGYGAVGTTSPGF